MTRVVLVWEDGCTEWLYSPYPCIPMGLDWGGARNPTRGHIMGAKYGFLFLRLMSRFLACSVLGHATPPLH